jgi:hypothetical protein
MRTDVTTACHCAGENRATALPGPQERRAFPWGSVEDWLTGDFGARGGRGADTPGRDA